MKRRIIFMQDESVFAEYEITNTIEVFFIRILERIIRFEEMQQKKEQRKQDALAKELTGDDDVLKNGESLM